MFRVMVRIHLCSRWFRVTVTVTVTVTVRGTVTVSATVSATVRATVRATVDLYSRWSAFNLDGRDTITGAYSRSN